MEKYTNSTPKRAKVVILISEKIDFKTKINFRTKKYIHYNEKEDITINTYAPKNRALKYMK